jgi:multiple antibiotic resistance protein
MTDTWGDLTRFGIGLFALLNPFTKLPYVLGIASGAGKGAVLTMAGSATAAAIGMLLFMHVLGEPVLVALGTSLPSFQVGGGLVIVLAGLRMLKDAPPPGASGLAHVDRSRGFFIRIGISPLGTPMLAGAGAISKVIIETQPHYGVEDAVLLAAVIVAVCTVAGLVLACATLLMRLLGASFLAILARLAGLVIVAVGFEVRSRGVMAHARNFAGS